MKSLQSSEAWWCSLEASQGRRWCVSSPVFRHVAEMSLCSVQPHHISSILCAEDARRCAERCSTRGAAVLDHMGCPAVCGLLLLVWVRTVMGASIGLCAENVRDRWTLFPKIDVAVPLIASPLLGISGIWLMVSVPRDPVQAGVHNF